MRHLTSCPNTPGSSDSELLAQKKIFFSENKPLVSYWGMCSGSCLAMQSGRSDWESDFAFYRLSTNPVFRPILYPYTLWDYMVPPNLKSVWSFMAWITLLIFNLQGPEDFRFHFSLFYQNEFIIHLFTCKFLKCCRLHHLLLFLLFFSCCEFIIFILPLLVTFH